MNCPERHGLWWSESPLSKRVPRDEAAARQTLTSYTEQIDQQQRRIEKETAKQAGVYAKEQKQVEDERAAMQAELSEREAFLDAKRETLEALIEDKSRGFELIGRAWEDYEHALARAQGLDLEVKSHPAPTAAEAVRDKGRALAEARRQAKVAEWRVALYEYHLPWITELLDEAEAESFVDAEEGVEDKSQRAADPASRWLSKDEYAALSTVDRNQRALDRYLRSRKTPWQLGRDYERYVGYLREQAGCAVTYQGIFRGLEDLGRDVLAEKDGTLEVIQCKRWAQRKTIHEKHIFQLFGTMVLCRIENPAKQVSGTFTTTTTLSETARAVAAHLGIKVEEGFPLGDYPRIKCNVARRTGEKIYHLPFDQQYDTAVVEPERGEFYAGTVAEAETAGYRRAFRWRPGTS